METPTVVPICLFFCVYCVSNFVKQEKVGEGLVLSTLCVRTGRSSRYGMMQLVAACGDWTDVLACASGTLRVLCHVAVQLASPSYHNPLSLPPHSVSLSALMP